MREGERKKRRLDGGSEERVREELANKSMRKELSRGRAGKEEEKLHCSKQESEGRNGVGRKEKGRER